ncbi:YdcF family protein [Luteimonas terricola]|uniref:YdcF family protein n=1 Tax=Luteimonas terricola TaxID=645597 RepID=UPI0010482DCC|nr:YdcF family protein [Luteimonas terricola]
MRRRRRHARPRRRLRWLLWLVLLVAAWLLGVAAWIVHVGNRDQAGPADAIVVLGAAAYDTRPSPVFTERIRHGIDLYEHGYAPTLVFTGGYGDGARFSESQVARSFALREGVPNEAILIETLSRTTHQNLLRARDVLSDHNLQRVIVVSDPLHMARALRLCRQLGIDAIGSPTPSSRFRSFRTQWRFLAREVYFFHRDLVVTPD